MSRTEWLLTIITVVLCSVMSGLATKVITDYSWRRQAIERGVGAWSIDEFGHARWRWTVERNKKGD